MKVFLGKKELEFRDGTTLATVVGPHEFKKINGIWVNGQPVPIEHFKSYVLCEGDRIKVLRGSMNAEVRYMRISCFN